MEATERKALATPEDRERRKGATLAFLARVARAVEAEGQVERARVLRERIGGDNA